MSKYVIKKKASVEGVMSAWDIADVFNNKRPKSLTRSVKKILRIKDKQERVHVSWRMTDGVILPAFAVNSKGIEKELTDKYVIISISDHDKNHVAQYTIDPFSGSPRFIDSINAISYIEFHHLILSACMSYKRPYFVVNMMHGSWPPKITHNIKIVDAAWDNLGFHLIMGDKINT